MWILTDIEENAQGRLNYFVEKTKIFIDTSSLLSYGIDTFWEHICPLLHEYNQKIIVPYGVIVELEKHKNSTKDSDLAKRAKLALEDLAQLRKDRMVEIYGDKNENFADHVFLNVFTNNRTKYRLTLISQDRDLAEDIENLNKINSVRAERVYAKRLTKYGYLGSYRFDKTPIPKISSIINTNKSVIKSGSVCANSFRLCNEITNIPIKSIQISCLPVVNDYAFDGNGQKIMLKQFIASGGEGDIYYTDTEFVAKIYKKHKNNTWKFEKIRLMLSKNIEYLGICYPKSILYNYKHEFIGYLMPKANGKELRTSLFIKPLFLKNFPNWTKRETVQLSVTILEKIKYLHDRNVVIGDINPSNILVVSPTEVYFVDTDSFQIEGFPCPVGTVNFTPPELQGKSFSSFLRSLGNENFAVATLLFMILLPGKPPYSQQGGESPGKNITSMDFSYPFQNIYNKKTPKGPWQFLWNHLPYEIQLAFFNTFHKDGENSSEFSRLSAEAWISLFRTYLKLLQNDTLLERDPMCNLLFPDQFIDNIKSQRILYHCSRCSKELYAETAELAKEHYLCDECNRYNKQTKMMKKCSKCDKTFIITNLEFEYCQSKGYEIRKLCNDCKDVARAKNLANEKLRTI